VRPSGVLKTAGELADMMTHSTPTRVPNTSQDGVNSRAQLGQSVVLLADILQRLDGSVVSPERAFS